MISEEVCSLPAEGENRPPFRQPSRFLARQPILNVRRQVVGYELLFRTGWQNHYYGKTDEATRHTLDSYPYLDIESLITEGGLVFVNCSREALVGRLVTLLPPDTTVLEILETVEPDAELVSACMELRQMGYVFALDDFVPRPEMQPLVEIADYIKVDFQLSDTETRREIHRMVHGTHAALLAEKLEDQEKYDLALAEGYKYFQGFYFCRPKLMSNRRIPPNRMNYLRLMVELSQNPLNILEITRIVKLEPSLCYRLLLLANSPLWCIRCEVTSVSHAFVLVGEDRFRALVSVAASCILSQDQPPALIGMSLERARFCELLAPLIGQNHSEQFMLGLLSLVDAMLGTPMESIVGSLPLRDEARAALLGEPNAAEVPLRLIRSFEAGAWGACLGTANDLGVSEETLARLYLQAVKWATDSLTVCRSRRSKV